ncbi:class I SAM-dependent methyltransferase [Winogradskyella ouciana]|uniref:class I SAM-dependent methyltransferase n=1 Tax=Winogradskyella ouciana TaxID=2608631 RepID=UPI003D2E2319
MTKYEFFRWVTFPIMTTHLVTVRKDIKQLLKQSKSNSKKTSVLDVGGRNSPYTINLPAEITLLDVPQEEGTREELNLGFTSEILNNIKERRSNIKDIVIQDMTKSTLPNDSYDAVVCIEVIEHVLEDAKFVENIAKVIRQGGWAYFTTPNGDYIKNEGPGSNPDHVRHYTRQELEGLLKKYFNEVDVHYAVKTGKHRVRGLKSFKLSNPIGVLTTMASNIINRIQSKGVENTPHETAHLIAIGYK